MIKLNKLNKFFNKGKSNEIHVINNTTLSFPSKGLISLLGESGSGKTTLLNVIGGLDSTSGTINFKEHEIKKYDSKTWDKIRSRSIGYVFQNYYLLENITIYENIEMVLKMIGITDPEEVDFRIKYVLEAVGMYRFRNKLASDLSGGQKQRVAIARAIVKNPDVIIADEPTGNLDSNTSIEILKIIKEISKEKLVLLVTHNKSLATNYSDRIINIVDGRVVSDDLSFSRETLDYVDKNIYLKDLETAETNKVKIYADSDINELDITLVKVNNNYYLKTSDSNVTVSILRDNSDIKLIDDYKKDFEDKFTEETTFNLETLESVKTPRTKGGIYGIKDSIIAAIRKLTSLGRRGKMQIVSLIVLGMMFSQSFLMFISTVTIDKTQYYGEKEIYRFDEKYNSVQNSFDFSDFPEDAIYFEELYPKLTKSGYERGLMGYKFAPKEMIGKENTPINEVFIDDTFLFTNSLHKVELESFGIYNKNHLIGQEVVESGHYHQFPVKLEIKGTVTNGSKLVYIDKSLINFDFSNHYDGFKKLTDDVVLRTDIVPPLMSGEIEIYISDSEYGNEFQIVEDMRYELYTRVDFKVIGYFTRDPNNEEQLDVNYYLEEKELLNLFINKRKMTYLDFAFPSKDAPEGMISNYDTVFGYFKEMRVIGLAAAIAQAVISLAITLLIFYFLVRSSLTERRKEISVLRNLGVSKREIRRLFIGEYLILSSATSLLGIFIGSLAINSLKGMDLEGLQMRVNLGSFLLTVGVMYVLNTIIGLMPVNKMIKKTPASLLTEYDI